MQPYQTYSIPYIGIFLSIITTQYMPLNLIWTSLFSQQAKSGPQQGKKWTKVVKAWLKLNLNIYFFKLLCFRFGLFAKKHIKSQSKRSPRRYCNAMRLLAILYVALIVLWYMCCFIINAVDNVFYSFYSVFKLGL